VGAVYFDFTEQDIVSDADVKSARALTSDLVNFMRTQTPYTVKRLLAADQKDMYDRHTSTLVDEELDEEYLEKLELETNWRVIRNSEKGGISVTSYFHYGRFVFTIAMMQLQLLVSFCNFNFKKYLCVSYARAVCMALFQKLRNGNALCVGEY